MGSKAGYGPVRGPLSLLHPSPSGDWLWQSGFVPTILTTSEEAGSMGEAANSIDFSHSSRKAWRTTNKLTCMSGRSSHLCPVSANSVASQLVKNGAHRTGGRESTRLISKQLSDLWKIPTPKGHSISEPFRSEEYAADLKRLKPGKSRGLDSVFPEFILHARSALKSCFCDASSCANSNFQRSGEEHQ